MVPLQAGGSFKRWGLWKEVRSLGCALERATETLDPLSVCASQCHEVSALPCTPAMMLYLTTGPSQQSQVTMDCKL
jgi:hypothetical protein